MAFSSLDSNVVCLPAGVGRISVQLCKKKQKKMDLDSAFIFSFKSSYVQLKGLNPLLLCSFPHVSQLTERCPTPPQLPTDSPQHPHHHHCSFTSCCHPSPLIFTPASYHPHHMLAYTANPPLSWPGKQQPRQT